ncbi:MAG: hypothetical protein RDV48_00695 [Candidatus Eremiobacteraeota bacterium]|nr:hypothetical protein [Candidatus Eremiobacteraeota bacterium]
MAHGRSLPVLVMTALVMLTGTVWPHLCDNVFRQADMLIVKPETYNLVVQDKASFKVFLQNNMDRGIAEISLLASSPAFDFVVTPSKMAIPKDQRVFFEVSMTVKKGMNTGNYPVNFKLVGGGREFKSFSLSTQGGGGSAAPGAAAMSSGPANLLIVPQSRGGIKIDGVIDDSVWSSSAVLSNFSSSAGSKALYQSVVLVSFNRECLNFGIRCSDESAEALSPEDRVDLYLSPKEPGKLKYHVSVSPDGKTTFDTQAHGGAPAPWNVGNARCRTSKMKKTWFAELSIPFAAFGTACPTAPQKWSIRIERTKASGKKEKSFWAADASGYNNDKGFGQIIINP